MKKIYKSKTNRNDFYNRYITNNSILAGNILVTVAALQKRVWRRKKLYASSHTESRLKLRAGVISSPINSIDNFPFSAVRHPERVFTELLGRQFAIDFRPEALPRSIMSSLRPAESGCRQLHPGGVILSGKLFHPFPRMRFRPCHALVDISKLLVTAPVRFGEKSPLRGGDSPIEIAGKQSSPRIKSVPLRISREKDSGEINVTEFGERRKLIAICRHDERREEIVSRVPTVWRHCLLKNRSSFVGRCIKCTHTHIYIYMHTYVNVCMYEWCKNAGIDRALLFAPMIKCRFDELFPDCPAWYEFSRHPMIASLSLFAFLSLLSFCYLSSSPLISLSHHRLYPQASIHIQSGSAEWMDRNMYSRKFEIESSRQNSQG